MGSNPGTLQNIFDHYIQSISSKFSHLETSEMGYRADFEILLKGIFESIKVKRVDHDAKAKQGNKPDFIVLNKDVPILYIEAKDIGVSLDKVEKSEQMARYFGYTNLVLTDYLEFRFYRNGLPYEQPIKIASYDLKKRIITPLSQNYEQVAKTLLDFTQSQKEPIKSGKHLSQIMGGKAQRIRDNLRHFLSFDSAQNIELVRVYEAIKKMLVHDLTIDTFSDMYAQTLVYGLFVARYYDDSPDTFSRQESRDLVPASNPFLQHFFDHIAGPNFDKRLSYIVDELCLVFQHADTKKLIEEYMGDADPVIHFYEDFLKEYDPALRKKMGAYYTPLPVVKFIIRSVDDILQKEFNLPNGLADTSKLPNNKHRVQILDPAVGTGTFISATIRTIYERLKKQGQEGRWPSYVHNDLLPRLYGFELMMTPYTIAHLKLSIALRKTGFKYFNETKTGKTRLRIYLTNSLEQSDTKQDLLSFGFAESIAEEAKEADKIKNQTPIMVVIGNPPYSGESSNKFYAGHDVYKVEPTGEKLKERNSKFLNDDYVKFIRFAENMIEKTGEGVVAMITAHGYLDNPTFRGMRWHLSKTFDTIRILDLHGNAKKKEIAPDGSKDENVFNIQQGVAIIVAVKTGKKKANEFACVYHTDIFGNRRNKFSILNNSRELQWQKIALDKQMFFFVRKNTEGKEDYEKGFQLNDLFLQFSTGILTKNDEVAIAFHKNEIWGNVKKFFIESEESLRSLFNLKRDSRDWVLKKAIDDIQRNYSEDNIVTVSYRPFDSRYTYYTGTSRGFMAYSQMRVMHNLFNKKNLALVSGRQGQVVGGMEWNLLFATKDISDLNIFYRGGGTVFPLYVYDRDSSRTPNFNMEIVDEIEKNVGKVSPEDIFDYIYAVLHSPSYREKYKEFLKIDFPHVPYPKDTITFKKLVAFGAELRSLHLLESPKANQFITTYPIVGSDTVEKLTYKNGKVFINAEQYFGNVPEVAWNFYIGGYQPAQKWLKDRKGRALTNTDIEHYQKIIVALAETNRIMKEIDSNI
jgi:predicted helicase